MRPAEIAQRVAKLTDAQREVLRHYRVRKSAKQIGRELGITHFAVNERLRSARRVLDVERSEEAARLLAEAETGEAYNRLVCEPPRIAEPAKHVMFSKPGEDGEWPSRAGRISAVREEQVPYMALSYPGLRLPFPRYRGDRNDLTITIRLMWIGALTVGFVVVLGSLITISTGVVRLVSQLIRALA